MRASPKWLSAKTNLRTGIPLAIWYHWGKGLPLKRLDMAQMAFLLILAFSGNLVTTPTNFSIHSLSKHIFLYVVLSPATFPKAQTAYDLFRKIEARCSYLINNFNRVRCEEINNDIKTIQTHNIFNILAGSGTNIGHCPSTLILYKSLVFFRR